MNVFIIAQEEIFYLPDNIDYLLKNLPSHIKIVGAIVLRQSPFGKKMSFLQKAYETASIFGLAFFTHYSFKYVLGKLSGKSVRKVFEQQDTPLIEVEGSINAPVVLDNIKSYEPDVIVSIAANQIFKKRLLSLPSRGCINLHTGLLPKYRGLMPTFWAMKNNEDNIGVSVFLMDEGIDNGPIIVQKILPIAKDKPMDHIIRETKHAGMVAIEEALIKLDAGDFELMENNEEDSTYFGFPARKDVKEFLTAGKKFF